MNAKSNKLLSLISSLDEHQLRECRKLVSSSFFGGNEELLAFYDKVVAAWQSGKKIDKTNLWKDVFGKSKKYNDTRFRKYSSDLSKLIKEYLIQDSMRSHEAARYFFYLQGLQNKRAEKLVNEVDRNWEKKVDSLVEGEPLDYYFRHLLERSKYELLRYDQRPTVKGNEEEISHHLDLYYFISKFQIASDVESRSRNERHQYRLQFIDEVTELLERSPEPMKVPLVEAFYRKYKMLAGDTSAEDFQEYKRMVLDPKIKDTQKYEFIVPTLNYSVRQITRGNRQYLHEYLEIFRFALAHNIAYEGDYMDPFAFKNTVQIAMRAGEFEWSKHFIETYKEVLPPRQRENALRYNLATLYFYQKDYDRALEYLRDSEYENINNNINAKTMLLAIYYDTDSYDSLDNLFDSISSFLTRHKELPTHLKQSVRNLISFTRRLTRILPSDREALEKIKRDLAEQRYVASRPWLEEKIEEFL